VKLFYILFLSLQCLVTVATAQVTLSAPTKMVALNEEFTVELRVTTRDSLSTLQFSFAWNAAVISFQRLDTIGGFPPSAEVNEFGLGNTANGKLAFLWLDRSSRGYRVPTDSFLIFKVVFKAVGANGTSCPLQFVATPTSIKASNADLVSVAVTGRDGNVKVGTTAVFSPNTEGVSLGQNFPNPVHNKVVIPVEFIASEDISFEVADLKGEIFLMNKYHFEAGRHEIRLDTEGVLPNGMYIYSIRSKRGVASRILIKN
jgi:Secretion system C-terminal sorting domain